MIKNVYIHLKLRPILFFMIFAVFKQVSAQQAKKGHSYFDETRYSFTKVVVVPEKSQADLYKMTRYWAADNTRTPREKIQVQDAASGRIIITGCFNVHRSGLLAPSEQISDYVLFTATLDTKDGKARIVMNNFVHYGGISESTTNSSGGSLSRDRASGNWFSKGRWKRIKAFVVDRSEAYLQGFEAALIGKGDYIAEDGF